MTAGDLAIVLAAILMTIGFAALIVVLLRVLDTLRSLRLEVDSLRRETGPLLAELRASTDEARYAVAEAREDLDRFDRVLGSAEAISGAMSNTARATRIALSAPVIKITALATGTSRAAKQLGREQKRIDRRARQDRRDLERPNRSETARKIR